MRRCHVLVNLQISVQASTFRHFISPHSKLPANMAAAIYSINIGYYISFCFCHWPYVMSILFGRLMTISIGLHEFTWPPWIHMCKPQSFTYVTLLLLSHSSVMCPENTTDLMSPLLQLSITEMNRVKVKLTVTTQRPSLAERGTGVTAEQRALWIIDTDSPLRNIWSCWRQLCPELSRNDYRNNK